MFFCRQAAYLCRKLVIHFYRNAKRYFVLFKSVDRGCGLELADSGKEKESGGREGWVVGWERATKSSPNFANSPMGHQTHWSSF